MDLTQDKVSEEKKPKTIVRGRSFQKIYATNLIGGGTEFDFRFELFNEKIKFPPDNKWTYVSDAMIILTPQAARKLQKLLDNFIKKYERDKGQDIGEPDLLDPSVKNYEG